jgi:hypothetical protein
MHITKKGKGRRSRAKFPKQLYDSAVPDRVYTTNFDSEKTVKMRYTSLIYSSIGSSTSLDWKYNLNSTYDPDRTGIGHQPLSRDVWVQFYNRYRVDGVKVTVKFAAAGSGLMATLVANNSGTAFSDMTTAMEQTGAINKTIMPSSRPETFSKYYSLPSITGVNRSVYNADDRYQAVVGASPTEAIVVHLVLQAASTSDAWFQIDLDYYTTFFDPYPQSLSLLDRMKTVLASRGENEKAKKEQNEALSFFKTVSKDNKDHTEIKTETVCGCVNLKH